MILPRQLLFGVLLLAITLLVFSCTHLDLQVQDWLYNSASGHWLWPKDEPVLRLFLYDGIKTLLIVMTLSLLTFRLVCRNHPWVRQHRVGIRVVVLSMILAPLLVAWLKSITGVACPKSLALYGGDLPYSGLFESLVHGITSASEQRCFPAGHASGGFALIAWVALADSPRGRRIALACALAVGWAMGVYKMAIGDHFLSHTLVSLELDWLVINTLFVLNQSSSVSMLLNASASS